jgi:hypothetical protein
MNFFSRLRAYKLTQGHEKETFYNKSRIKLILVVFPLLIAFCAFIKKFLDFDGHSIYLVGTLLAIVVVNLGADYLTKQKFKDL